MQIAHTLSKGAQGQGCARLFQTQCRSPYHHDKMAIQYRRQPLSRQSAA